MTRFNRTMDGNIFVFLILTLAAVEVAVGLAIIVALFRKRQTLRVDELNAVTCGGEPGVSDTFAAALWELDTQFWMASTGVDAVDVHIHPGAPAGQLFTFQQQSGRWTGSVRPASAPAAGR